MPLTDELLGALVVAHEAEQAAARHAGCCQVLRHITQGHLRGLGQDCCQLLHGAYMVGECATGCPQAPSHNRLLQCKHAG